MKMNKTFESIVDYNMQKQELEKTKDVIAYLELLEYEKIAKNNIKDSIKEHETANKEFKTVIDGKKFRLIIKNYPVKRFSSIKLKQDMPEIYNKYTTESFTVRIVCKLFNKNKKYKGDK